MYYFREGNPTFTDSLTFLLFPVNHVTIGSPTFINPAADPAKIFEFFSFMSALIKFLKEIKPVQLKIPNLVENIILRVYQ